MLYPMIHVPFACSKPSLAPCNPKDELRDTCGDGQRDQCILFSVVFTPTCHLSTLNEHCIAGVGFCLIIWWKRFCGTQKEDDRGPLSIQSSLGLGVPNPASPFPLLTAQLHLNHRSGNTATLVNLPFLLCIEVMQLILYMHRKIILHIECMPTHLI